MPDRAVVAVRDDREWVVFLERHQEWMDAGEEEWQIFRWDEPHGCRFICVARAIDAGQDAHEVLAAFLREREA